MDPEDQNNSQGHPAWQEILSDIPAELHPLITPKLQEWDQKVQGKLQETSSKFDPYKEIVEAGVDPQYLNQALWLAQQFETDPTEVIKTAIQSYELQDQLKDLLPNVQQQQSTDPSNEPDELEFDMDNPLAGLENHPAFKSLSEKLEQANSILSQQQQSQQAQADEEALAEYLESLHTGPDGNRVEFDDLFVTTMLANGMDGDQAVELFQNNVKSFAEQAGLALNPGQQQQQQQQTPVIMGSAATTGSGIPESPTKMGDLKNGEVNDLVIQMLEAAARSDQQTD